MVIHVESFEFEGMNGLEALWESERVKVKEADARSY